MQGILILELRLSHLFPYHYISSPSQFPRSFESAKFNGYNNCHVHNWYTLVHFGIRPLIRGNGSHRSLGNIYTCPQTKVESTAIWFLRGSQVVVTRYVIFQFNNNGPPSFWEHVMLQNCQKLVRCFKTCRLYCAHQAQINKVEMLWIKTSEPSNDCKISWLQKVHYGS